jgi:GxxExxY protein
MKNAAEVDETGILFKNESYEIQGAIFEVYKTLGSGFLESVYQESLEHELRLRDIPFKSQPELKIKYKEVILNQFYKADFVCYDSIIIELKACRDIDSIHRAQLINYLKATELKLGMLVNFGAFPKVKIERIAL